MSENILGERIRKMREIGMLSQVDLADQLGISRLSIGNYEKGDRTPDSMLLKKMSVLFSCSADYLLGLSDAIKPENTILVENFGLSEESIHAMQEMYITKKILPNIDGELMPFFNLVISSHNFIDFISHLQILATHYIPDNCFSKGSELKIVYPESLGDGSTIITENLLMDIEIKRMHDSVDSLLASIRSISTFHNVWINDLLDL